MLTHFVQGLKGQEPYYGIDVAEFEKRILYSARMGVWICAKCELSKPNILDANLVFILWHPSTPARHPSQLSRKARLVFAPSFIQNQVTTDC